MDVLEARGISSEIKEDTSCIRCGYNLRGLSPAGLCPECATPIGRSLRGDLLKYADPDWLEKLRFGASLKLWNILLGILLGVGASFMVAVVQLPQAVALVTTWIGAALGLWATFLITAQEPRISLQEDTVTLRTAIRFCATAGFFGAMLQPILGSVGMTLPILLISSACSLLGFVAWFGELVYFRRFARRIPDPRLAKTTSTLMWTQGIGVGVAVIVGGVTFTAARVATAPAAGPRVAVTTGGAPAVPVLPAAPGAGALVAFLGCSFAVAALVWFLVYVRVLIKYRAAFRAAATHARQAAPAAPPTLDSA